MTWIDYRGRQHRVYRNTGLDGPKRAHEPFATKEQAKLFIQLARASSLHAALAYIRDPHPAALRVLLGMPPVDDAGPAVAGVVDIAGAISPSAPPRRACVAHDRQVAVDGPELAVGW